MISLRRLLLPTFALLAGSLWSQSELPPDVEQSLGRIRPEALRAHLEFLADDALEGRGTGTRGYNLAAKYVRSNFQGERLRSAIPDGSYFQKVALRHTDVDADATSITLERKSEKGRLIYNQDFVLLDTHVRTSGSVSAPLAFAGYGVTAPELSYDDYAGLDVKGKIVVVFFLESPATFPATERSYYMDHHVKRETAGAHGAIGMIEISTPPTEERFPWAFVLREVKIGYNSLQWLDRNQQPFGLDDQIIASGLLSRSGAAALFAGESHSLEEIFAMAKSGKPASFQLSKTAQISYKARHTPVDSVNVVGVLPGSDPALRKEYVVFSAHLDHLGIGSPLDGDSIYNGALDNAAGSSVLLAVSQFFA